jgi:hypothetical protein
MSGGRTNPHEFWFYEALLIFISLSEEGGFDPAQTLSISSKAYLSPVNCYLCMCFGWNAV